MSLCASVYMCFVVTCWERADLLALVCGVYCEFVTFPLVSWVRCGTWLYRFLIFAPLLTLMTSQCDGFGYQFQLINLSRGLNFFYNLLWRHIKRTEYPQHVWVEKENAISISINYGFSLKGFFWVPSTCFGWEIKHIFYFALLVWDLNVLGVFFNFNIISMRGLFQTPITCFGWKKWFSVRYKTVVIPVSCFKNNGSVCQYFFQNSAFRVGKFILPRRWGLFTFRFDRYPYDDQQKCETSVRNCLQVPEIDWQYHFRCH